MRKMKDSGIEWIGQIPEEWEVAPIKFYCKYIYAGGTPQSTNPNYWDGDIPWIPSGSCQNGIINQAPKSITKLGFNSSSTKLIPANTTVMAMTGATCSNVGFVTFETCANQSVVAYIHKKEVEPKYLFYSLQAAKEYILTYQTGGAQAGINVDECKNFIIPYIDTKYQTRIATYLDRKCSEIDSVVRETEQTIEEYKKLKQSLISEVVTGKKRVAADGLSLSNEPRKMKDSGVNWLSDIPIDWDVQKLKYVFRIKKDIAGREGLTVLSITQKGVKPKDLSKNEGQIAESYKNYQLVNIGDFAMNHMDLLTGWVDISKYDGVTSPDYRVFILLDEDTNDKDYYLFLFQMCYTNRIFYNMGQGVSGMGRWRLQADKFLNFELPIPSKEEQKLIAQYLSTKCSEIDNLIADKQTLLQELDTYKKSLIYECVTGKREVN